MLNDRMPAGMCPTHRTIWLAWRENHYDPRDPKDWPGQHIMDSRTSHAERGRRWDEKNREQMQLAERCCRRGNSLQCDNPTGDGTCTRCGARLSVGGTGRETPFSRVGDTYPIHCPGTDTLHDFRPHTDLKEAHRG